MADKSEALTTSGYQITRVTLQRNCSIKLPRLYCAWRGKKMKILDVWPLSFLNERALEGFLTRATAHSLWLRQHWEMPRNWAVSDHRWDVPGLSPSSLGFQVKNASFVVLQEGWYIWQGGMAPGVGRVAGWTPRSHSHPTATVRVSGVGSGNLSQAQLEDN